MSTPSLPELPRFPSLLGICLVDSQKRIRYLNSQAARLLRGVATDQVRGLTLERLPLMAATLSALVDSLLSRKQTMGQTTILDPSDESNWSVQLHLVEGPDLVNGMVALTFQRLPQSVCTSGCLSSEWQQFELIANSIPQLAWMARGDGYIFWYNQRWFEYTGTRQQDMEGWGWQTVHDGAELPRVMQKWNAALSSGQPWEDTFSLRRHDGEMRLHLSRARPLHDEDGRLLFWFGTNTDIEDQIRQQQELVQTREQLKLSLEAGELGIFHCPLPLGKIVWNAKCKEHFHLPPEVEIDYQLFLSLIHPADRERVDLAVRATVEKGEPYDIRYRTVNPAAGEVRWIRAKGRTYFDATCQPTRFDGITIDASEEVRQAEERQALLLAEQSARLEAERSSRMKDDFLATLSHELRTPLSAVLGWAQLLQPLVLENPDVLSGLQTIERNARIQQKLVEDLLDVSRIVSGKLLITMAPVDVVEVVTTVAKSLENFALAKQITIELEIGNPENYSVHGDFSRLQQIVSNILGNAIKFTPAGGHIKIELFAGDRHLEICITDSGPGIAPDFLPHIFERFRQSDSSTTRRHGGLGLGLALAKQLAELHGGTIRAANRSVSAGAVFSLMLPNAVGSIASAPTDAGLSAPLDPELIKGLKIVSVDDDKDIRRWLERLLANFGATVFSASSAEEALELVRREKPDVLLSDIGMPREDGYSLISRLRQLPADSGGLLPAAALTAFARPEDRAKVLAAGYQAHLTKPIDPTRIILTLATLAGRFTDRSRELRPD